MDYESKILLNNLIDAVSGTDWWIVGITFVNAVIMFWLGLNQYKLQKRQTEAQEYDIYRKLYKLLINANNEIDGFLHSLWGALWEPQYELDKDFLQRKRVFIDDLRKDLSESYIDYELKFSKDTFNKDGYLQILSLMSHIIRQMVLSLEKKEVHLVQGVHSIECENNDMDKTYAVSIARHFKGYLQVAIMQNLNVFVQHKRTVRCDNAVLDKIRKKCKID